MWLFLVFHSFLYLLEYLLQDEQDVVILLYLLLLLQQQQLRTHISTGIKHKEVVKKRAGWFEDVCSKKTACGAREAIRRETEYGTFFSFLYSLLEFTHVDGKNFSLFSFTFFQ